MTMALKRKKLTVSDKVKIIKEMQRHTAEKQLIMQSVLGCVYHR